MGPGQTRRQRPCVDGQRGQPGEGRRPERSRAGSGGAGSGGRDRCIPLTSAGARPHLRRPAAVRQAAGPGRRRRGRSNRRQPRPGRCSPPGCPPDASSRTIALKVITHWPPGGSTAKRPRNVRPSQAADVPCTVPGSSSAGSTSSSTICRADASARVTRSQGEPHRGARPGLQTVDRLHQGQRCGSAARDGRGRAGGYRGGSGQARRRRGRCAGWQGGRRITA